MDGAQKLSYWAAVLTLANSRSINELARPTVSMSVQSMLHSANWQPASPLGDPRVGGSLRFPPHLYSRYECTEHRLVRRKIYNRRFGSFQSSAVRKGICFWCDRQNQNNRIRTTELEQQNQSNRTRTTATAPTWRAKEQLQTLWRWVRRSKQGANWAEKTLGP